jgi:hypothetical protein
MKLFVKVLKIVGITFGVMTVALLALGVYLQKSGYVAPPRAVTPSTSSKPAVLVNPVDTLKTQLVRALGAGNRKVGRLTSVDLSGDRLAIIWTLNDNLTAGMIALGGKKDAAAILKAVSESTVPYASVYLGGTMKMTDAFGNASESRVMKAVFSRENIARISWAGFSYDRVYDIAEDVDLHQQLR